MPKPPRVIVTDFLTGPLSIEHEILGDVADVVGLNAGSEEDLIGHVEDAAALMLYHVIGLTERSIGRLQNCRLIVRCGVGVDNVDRTFARSRGIPVANVPDYGTEEVADSALGMLLAMARGITPANSMLRAGIGAWSYTEIAPLPRLRGQVLGVIGLGRIGTAMALRGKALGMDVIFLDPMLPDGYEKALGIRRAVSLEELLPQTYALSLHCPLTEQTHHLINARALSLLPRGALLVNTARGAVVDTTAIPAAIASGQLAGAGIDVLEAEPPKPGDPLVLASRDPHHLAHHRVIINAHSAFYCEDGLREMRVKGSQACRNAILGLPLRNVVN